MTCFKAEPGASEDSALPAAPSYHPLLCSLNTNSFLLDPSYLNMTQTPLIDSAPQAPDEFVLIPTWKPISLELVSVQSLELHRCCLQLTVWLADLCY